MCQLLGISSIEPTPTFSSLLLKPFVQRGGKTDIHSHGWGVTTICKQRLLSIRDTSPAATSIKCQELIDGLIGGSENREMLESQTLLAHIRYATVGEVSIENVHPFHRKLFGVEFVFAHNGDVPTSYFTELNTDSSYVQTYLPEGNTDSEYIFCHILNALSSKFDTFPSLQDLYFAIHEICSDIVQQKNAILNFLLAFGDHMFAYSWPGARPGSKVWNGLHYMLKERVITDEEHRSDKVAVIATKPLTDDDCELTQLSSWIEFKRGDLLLFSKGVVLTTHFQ